MTDIILHHYPQSPFARKIRCILGAKQLDWKSVIIPRIMPKPDVVALTGGYRKTPVLQIGADILCDTALIARKLNTLAPVPDLYPDHAVAGANAMSAWADSSLFQCAVPLVFMMDVLKKGFAGREEEMRALIEDRAAMRKGAPSAPVPLVEARNTFTLFLSQLEKQLGNGQDFLFGNAPVIADFSVYHPLWFVATKPVVGELLQPFHAVRRWMDRIDSFGEGNSTEISSGEALAIARKASIKKEKSGSLHPEFLPGSAIVVQPTDYGIVPVSGTLLYCDAHEVVLARTDDRAGEVAVHFPRANYSITRA